MEKMIIICVDDQREVLATLRKDLILFESHCELIECESTDEVDEVLEEIDSAGKIPALIICDHVMQYFTPDIQFEFLRRLAAAVRPAGFLYASTPSAQIADQTTTRFPFERIDRLYVASRGADLFTCGRVASDDKARGGGESADQRDDMEPIHLLALCRIKTRAYGGS